MQGEVIVSNQHFELKINEGIFTCRYLTEHVTLEIAESCMEESLKITGGKMYPALFDNRHAKVFEKNVRQYYAQMDSPKIVKAAALLIHSSSQELVSNLFIHFYKMPVPAKVFREEAAALEWLKRFI